MNRDVVDVSKLLKIRDDFLNRNKNLMYGVLKFLLGPLFAMIMLQDSTRRAFNYEFTYYVAYVAAFVVCFYLVVALIFDIYAYLKPLQKVTLSSKQLQLLNWPPNYPAELIETPTTTVLEQERLKRLGISPLSSPSSSPSPSPLPSSTPLTFGTQQTPVRTQTPAYTQPPAPAQSATPASSFVSSFFSSPFRATPQQPPQTPAPISTPFSSSSLPSSSTMGTPVQPSTTTSLYPQTPFSSFPSPQTQTSYTPSTQPQQTTFTSPQQPFSSPFPSTSPYPSSTPFPSSTLTPATSLAQPSQTIGSPAALSPSSVPSSPLSPSQSPTPNLRTSRFGFATPDLATESSLRRYVESVKLQTEKKGSSRIGYNPAPSYPPTSPTTQLPRYRVSYNGPPRTQTPQPEIEEDLYAYQASALQALQDEGIFNMEDYVERMQEWLGSRLIPYVTLYVNLYLNREKPENQQQWNTFRPHIQEYLDMSAYGFVQPNSADYVAGRIKELQHGAVISKYNWCRGSDGEVGSVVWDSRYPCDAQLLMHLFCTFLDLHLVQDPTRPSGKPFTNKYFARSPAFPARNPQPVIFQKYVYAPHFELVLPDGKLWPVQQGYNNLFHTLVCFIWQITKNSNGYLGPISISDPEINLSWVVGD